jgi:adenylylsulfate kinase-like enzyme
VRSRRWRDTAREELGERFVEVYVKASVEECARRDVKGLYVNAFAGEIKGFTGIDDPYEAPSKPELHLAGDSAEPTELAQQVIDYLKARRKIGEAAVKT